MRKTREIMALDPKKPWLRRRQRPLRGEQLLVVDKLPRIQLNIYDDHVILTRREQSRRGRWRTYTSYPVSPLGVVQALAKLPASTGLLPEGVLGTGLIGGKPFYVVLIPPQVATIPVAEGYEKTVEHTIPLPPLIWAGYLGNYRIFALPQTAYPSTPSLRLARAPFANVYGDGSICWGDADRPPQAAPSTMLPALELFLTGSRFNEHLANGKSQQWPGNILAAYPHLDPAQSYPLDDLVSAGITLERVLGGHVWTT